MTNLLDKADNLYWSLTISNDKNISSGFYKKSEATLHNFENKWFIVTTGIEIKYILLLYLFMLDFQTVIHIVLRFVKMYPNYF